MEEELKAAKEACTDRVGEVGIGRQIAGNVRDLIITRHSIARIEAVTKAIPVCAELKKHPDDERVASAAVNKLYDLFQTEVRSAGEEALGQRVVCIEDMLLSADAIELVVARMLNHGGNECSHVRGSWLLGAFPRHNRKEARIS